MNRKIKQLRTRLRQSKAAYDFSNLINLSFNGIFIKKEMQRLNDLLIVEIKKDNQDLSKIDNLLSEMKKLIESSNNHIDFIIWMLNINAKH